MKTAPAIFQSTMDKFLNGLKGVVVYFDDILIRGETLKICQENLFAVLECLRKHNIHCNLQKFLFFQEKVSFLGHEISSKGIGPSYTKIKAICEMPAPTDLSRLRSFLGAVNFYGKFIKNL